jgi:hypothetical protein
MARRMNSSVTRRSTASGASGHACSMPMPPPALAQGIYQLTAGELGASGRGIEDTR